MSGSTWEGARRHWPSGKQGRRTVRRHCTPACHRVETDDGLAPDVGERVERPLRKESSWFPMTRKQPSTRRPLLGRLKEMKMMRPPQKRVRRHSRQLSPAGGGWVPVNRIKRVTEQGQSCNGTVLSNKKQRRTGARTGVTHVPRGSQSPEKACLRRR